MSPKCHSAVISVMYVIVCSLRRTAPYLYLCTLLRLESSGGELQSILYSFHSTVARPAVRLVVWSNGRWHDRSCDLKIGAANSCDFQRGKDQSQRYIQAN